MDTDRSEPRAADDLAALRRRVYAPDSTAEDVDRYRAALRAARPEPKPESEPEPAARDAPEAVEESAGGIRVPLRRAVRFAPAIATAVLLCALGVGWSIAASAPRPAPAAVRPRSDAVALDVPASARDGFSISLLQGHGANLSGYLFDHPQARPPQLTTLTRADTQEYSGTGGVTVSLAPPADANQGGHLTVILTLGTDDDVTWLAARIARDRVQQVAMRIHAQATGLPLSTTVPYTGQAATLLSVSVPRGTRWDALVVFSN